MRSVCGLRPVRCSLHSVIVRAAFGLGVRSRPSACAGLGPVRCPHHSVIRACGLRPCRCHAQCVSSHSLASLTRAPSLRSVAVLRCAQPSLRSARGFATPLAPLSLSFTVRSRTQRAGVVALFFGRDTRKARTHKRGPMGPRPTHVCLVRETRLLPPKAGRLASRSAKPTLDGSSLIKC